MKVSIITPTYNSLAFIGETIESIFNQTHTNWELLITDDFSSDGTWEKLMEYAKKDERVKIFKLKKNSGPGVARNNSIKKATGRFIAFCDSDDVWHSDKLEKQICFLKQNDLSFTFTSYQKINEKGEKGGIINALKRITYDDLLRTCSIGCSTAIYDTGKIGKVYMPDIRKRQDYGLWLKIFKEIGATKGMKEVLTYYRIHSNSLSRNKFVAAKYHFQVLRKIANLTILKAGYYFIIYAFVGMNKYLK